jgi:23S rRNA-/tRNA-specific pseudouridylate synthase
VTYKDPFQAFPLRAVATQTRETMALGHPFRHLLVWPNNRTRTFMAIATSSPGRSRINEYAGRRRLRRPSGSNDLAPLGRHVWDHVWTKSNMEIFPNHPCRRPMATTTTPTTKQEQPQPPLPCTDHDDHANDDSVDDTTDDRLLRCCWGGSTMAELVRVVSKDQVILYDDENYTVVNKPPDLRMDDGGKQKHHECTIHKLLQHWYKDITFRHAHQLDFATSGLLLFAKNVAAARAAGMAFEARQVEKVYTAVVCGIVQRSTEASRCWTRSELRTALAATELRFRKSRGRRQQHKWVGFQPPHSVFQMWKGQQQQQQQQKTNTSGGKHPTKHLRLLPADQWTEVWAPLAILTERERQILHHAESSWKSAITKERNIVQAFQQCATIYNELKRPPPDDDDDNADNGTKIPMFVPLQDDDDDDDNKNGEDAATTQKASFSFAVYLSVDESLDANEFRMTVPVDNPYVPVDKSPPDDNSNKSGRGRPCLSVLTVLQYDFPNQTTTVRLEPWTGRRHQLRVHCAVAGYPIVGDVNYGGGTTSTLAGAATTTTEEEKRLHLHSTVLRIPTIGIDVECYDPGFGMTIPTPTLSRKAAAAAASAAPAGGDSAPRPPPP